MYFFFQRELNRLHAYKLRDYGSDGVVEIGPNLYIVGGLGRASLCITCPGGAANPFLHLRLGQCAFGKNSMDEAAEHLARAYMLEGAESFVQIVLNISNS